MHACVSSLPRLKLRMSSSILQVVCIENFTFHFPSTTFDAHYITQVKMKRRMFVFLLTSVSPRINRIHTKAELFKFSYHVLGWSTQVSTFFTGSYGSASPATVFYGFLLLNGIHERFLILYYIHVSSIMSMNPHKFDWYSLMSSPLLCVVTVLFWE